MTANGVRVYPMVALSAHNVGCGLHGPLVDRRPSEPPAPRACHLARRLLCRRMLDKEVGRTAVGHPTILPGIGRLTRRRGDPLVPWKVHPDVRRSPAGAVQLVLQPARSMKMMKSGAAPKLRPAIGWGLALALAAMVTAPAIALAQTGPGTENGEWRYIGGSAWHTRYADLDEITAENFEELQPIWEWSGASFGAVSSRSTPIYVNGSLYTVMGPRRHVISLDPVTGETLWSYREPNTHRFEYSMRQDYGKGVAYAEIDGREVIYAVTPGFFLHAFDARSGQHLEDWGEPVQVEGFPGSGVVDLLADLVDGWGVWEEASMEFDAYEGIPLEMGYITNSSPPIVVNDVVVVGNSAEQGYQQSRIENIPGDILAYDARTGEHLWKFHVIPRPGEFGHDTWENDAWQWTGDVSSWAPMAADPELGLVYIVTNPPTIDYFAGFSPGANLFGTSIIALDVETGERRWHFQFVHHDVWNYDTSTAPILMDVTIDGEQVPIVAQATKQGFVYVLNRETGEPIWPIEERPVPESQIPEEQLSPTQPFPTRPAPFEMQGLPEDMVIDYTPELRQEALAILEDYEWGPIFNPPLHRDNDNGKRSAVWCPGDGGGTNINGPAAADPVGGIMYVTSQRACSAQLVIPGTERDAALEAPTGATPAAWVSGGSAGFSGPQELPIFKPPYSTITAIDMKTGEHLWQIPSGDTPDRIRDHPALQGVELPESTGAGRNVAMTATETLLLYQGEGSDGTPFLIGIDKMTGQEVGRVEVPTRTSYGMMSFEHDGHQYVMLLTTAGLTTFGLPGTPIPGEGGGH
ncbi:MAG: PQQ-binding-like beta-propeller repeat protein [Gemmatimonas sp.]|nr:PQQ-binding-like beta-propeller repeat protein [Gemmatimonas sp.]